MLATLFLICSNKHRIEIDSITKSLNWLLSSTIIVQGGQYLGKVFGRPIIMLISVPGNTHNNMDWCLHFLQRYFCRAAKYDGYHIEMEKTDGGEGGEVSTYWGRLRNRGPPSEDGSKLELASWRNEPISFQVHVEVFWMNLSQPTCFLLSEFWCALGCPCSTSETALAEMSFNWKTYFPNWSQVRRNT